MLRFLPAGTASLNMLAIPVIALLSSMAVFGERLSASEWVGIGCIGVGLAVISLRAWYRGAAAASGGAPRADPARRRLMRSAMTHAPAPPDIAKLRIDRGLAPVRASRRRRWLWLGGVVLASSARAAWYALQPHPVAVTTTRS